MATALVVLVSLLVGAATYVATVRGGRRSPTAVGFEGPSAAASTTDAVARPAPAEDDAVGVAKVVALGVVREVPDPGEDDAPSQGAEGATEGVTEPLPDAATPEGADRAQVPPPPLAPVIVSAPPGPALDPGYSYLRVATEGPSWRDRVAGVLGLTIMLVIGAGTVAFAIYQLGSAVNAVIQRFLEG
ncbi:MAG TPA: hypothetical protein VEC15_07670 [Actinomycetota bacterium]|nr:hypothetical protein [Actinomycetota bacterium]